MSWLQRLNIAHAVGVVSTFMANPCKAHWEAIKSVKGKHLCYGKGSLQLHGLCNAYMASDVDIHKSTSRYAFTLVGGLVS